MTNPDLIRRASAPFAAAAMLLAMSTPALAGPPGDPGQGPAERSAAVTEDDDTNDGNTPNDVGDETDNAHASGTDRSVENGRSGNQGRAAHDPDDDGKGPDRSNGGLDQPDGPGGLDLADQDGNNGCGNDDDFEDDNEGWCGKPSEPEAAAPEEAEVEGSEVVTTPGASEQPQATVVEEAEVEVEHELAPETGDLAVLPAEITRTQVPAAAPPQPAEVEVLGDTVTRSLGALAADAGPSGTSTLPRTGAGLLALAGIGAALAGIGGVLARIGRRDEV